MNITILDINIDVIKKDIKNARLTAYPPYWDIKFFVPQNISDDIIKTFLLSKITWIKKQIKNFSVQHRQSTREYVDWESHYFLWKRYIMKVEKSNQNSINIKNNKYIILSTKDSENAIKKQKILEKWYKKNLENILEDIFKNYSNITWLQHQEFRIKKMKTKRWTCNIEAKRIWINLELAKKEKIYIEYVVLHELIHLIERHHNKNFKAYMDKYMPNWRYIRKALQESMI